MSPYQLASSLVPSDVGKRVVIRHRLPDGQPTDVLGELDSWDPLSVRRRDGAVVVLDASAVLAGKVIAAHWARDVASGELQRIASDGWPAVERAALGAWELRAAAGFTKRANSVLAVGSPGLPIDEALASVRAWYAQRGLPAVVQVPLPLAASLDADLDARGWTAGSLSHVLVAELRDLTVESGSLATVSSMPSPDWLAAHLKPPPEALGVLIPGIYVSVQRDGAIAGVARGSVVRDWLLVSGLWVTEAQRRQGLALTLMGALFEAAHELPARHAFLQVEDDNAVARAMYAKMGFTHHHSYVYRAAP